MVNTLKDKRKEYILKLFSQSIEGLDVIQLYVETGILKQFDDLAKMILKNGTEKTDVTVYCAEVYDYYLNIEDGNVEIDVPTSGDDGEYEQYISMVGKLNNSLDGVVDINITYEQGDLMEYEDEDKEE